MIAVTLALFAACAPHAPPRAPVAAEAAICGRWSGVARVGTRWTYATTAAYTARHGFAGTSEVVVAAIAGDTVTLRETGAQEGPSGRFRWARVDTWRCDGASAWWVRSVGRTRGISGGRRVATSAARTFAPGWRVRPGPAPAAWTDTFTVTRAARGRAGTTPATCATTVSAPEAREVLGRTVRTVHVTPACDGATLDAAWLAEGIGLVETDDKRLIAYLP